jgi:hypothetical protein
MIRMNKVRIVIVALSAFLAIQARATLFDLTYSDPSGDFAVGQVTADYLGGNQYLATSATLNVSSAANPLINGIYTLLAGGPAAFIPPPGVFEADNVLYYPSDPALDVYGLLGFQSTVGGGIELNIWGNSPGNYSFYASLPGGGYNPAYNGAGTLTLTSVPEASTVIAGLLLMLPFGASALRVLRRNATA